MGRAAVADRGDHWAGEAMREAGWPALRVSAKEEAMAPIILTLHPFLLVPHVHSHQPIQAEARGRRRSPTQVTGQPPETEQCEEWTWRGAHGKHPNIMCYLLVLTFLFFTEPTRTETPPWRELGLHQPGSRWVPSTWHLTSVH